MQSELIERAVSYIRELFSSDHGGHDASHTMRVYKNAMRITLNEPECDKEIVALGALLHDADDYKLFNTVDNLNARRFLSAQGMPPDRTERIVHVINGVSFSKNKGKKPDTIEGCIVQDADRLDAIGAVGIARTFAFGGERGRTLEETVQHFYDKLLLLKDTMSTEAAKAMAEERHAFLLSFLDEWNTETAVSSENDIPVL